MDNEHSGFDHWSTEFRQLREQMHTSACPLIQVDSQPMPLCARDAVAERCEMQGSRPGAFGAFGADGS